MKKCLIASELNAVLAFQIRRELGTVGRMRMDARELVKLFVKEYERKYSDILPVSKCVSTTYMRRALMWCGNDEKRLEGIIRWLVNNWESISSQIGFSGKPTISLFGTATLFQRIRDLKENPEIRCSVKNRFSHSDSSPKEGWGE